MKLICSSSRKLIGVLGGLQTMHSMKIVVVETLKAEDKFLIHLYTFCLFLYT